MKEKREWGREGERGERKQAVRQANLDWEEEGWITSPCRILIWDSNLAKWAKGSYLVRMPSTCIHVLCRGRKFFF